MARGRCPAARDEPRAVHAQVAVQGQAASRAGSGCACRARAPRCTPAPVRSAVASAGTRRSKRRSATRSRSARSRRCAVSQTVSPSGTSGRRQPRSRRPRGVGRKPAASSAVAQRRDATIGCAVGPLDLHLAQRAVADRQGQRVGRRLQDGVVVGEGQQRPAAALDVEHARAVDEDDERPGLAAGLMAAARRRQAALAASGRRRSDAAARWPARAARRRTALAGSVAARTSAGAGVAGVQRAGLRAQPVDRARQRELCGAEALDEVAAAGPAGLLGRLEHRVDRGEATGDPLADHGAAGDQRRTGRAAPRRRRPPVGSTSLVAGGQPRPAPGHRRRCRSGRDDARRDEPAVAGRTGHAGYAAGASARVRRPSRAAHGSARACRW